METGSALISREALALDALIRLNRQIAEQPDIYALVNYFLLTVVGQFSVSDSFITIPNPSSTSDRPLFFATGSFKDDFQLADPDLLESLLSLFGQESTDDVTPVTSLTGKHATALKLGGQKKAELILPLYRENKPFGVLGVAKKVTGKPFSHSDIALLQGLLDAMVPFISILRREYYDLFNSTRQGVLIFDSDRRLTRINEAAMKILKAAFHDEIIISSVHGMSIEKVFSDPPFHEWVDEILQVGKTRETGKIENLIARQDGTERVFDVRVTSINQMTKTQHDLLLVLEDVTDRRDREIRLHELQRHADVGVMISSIAHEMKNYIGILSGGVELARHYARNEQFERVDERLSQFGQHLSTMHNFLAKVMKSSRNENRPRLINLNDVVTETVDFARVQKNFRSVRVRVTGENENLQVMIDPDSLAQTLLNLLNNSADAIAEKGSPHGLIDIEQMRRDDGLIALVVSDNGCGMTPEVRDGVFKRQITTKKNGFGFGLITCATILQKQNATIQVESELGIGTTISIIFPDPATTVGEFRPAHHTAAE